MSDVVPAQQYSDNMSNKIPTVVNIDAIIQVLISCAHVDKAIDVVKNPIWLHFDMTN